MKARLHIIILGLLIALSACTQRDELAVDTTSNELQDLCDFTI